MSVPDRFHIAWKNDLAGLTLASTVAAESAYPLTNMQNAHANDFTVIDMTGQTTVSITDTDSPDTFKTALAFALHNHNLPDGTTVRLRLFDAINQGGTNVYDSTATDIMHNIPFGSVIAGIDAIEGNFEDEGQMKTHFSLWFEAVEWKSLQIDITNADGFTNNQIIIDKGYLAFAYCPEYGPERGFESSQVDPSEHMRKPGGGMETVEYEPYRTMNLEFKNVLNSERHVLRHILDRAKKGGDLLITMDPNDEQSFNYETTSIYRRTSNNSFANMFFNGNEFGLSLEEN